MTKEAIEARLKDLEIQAETFRANLNAIAGAKQDCEYWLKVLDKPAPPAHD